MSAVAAEKSQHSYHDIYHVCTACLPHCSLSAAINTCISDERSVRVKLTAPSFVFKNGPNLMMDRSMSKKTEEVNGV